MPQQNFGGVEYNVREESFEPIREEWNEYRLQSGVRVRIRLNVQKIFRILDDKGQPAINPEGDPFLMVRQNIQVVASVPDSPPN